MEQLARIPFTREEEQTITSMARWMRFMAVIGIVGSILMLFFVVFGIGFISVGSEMIQNSPQGARLQKLIEGAGVWVYLFLAAFLIGAGGMLWQSLVLYHASDYFDLMARTDAADLEYLSSGLDKLRVFFKVKIMVVVVIALASVCTGFTLVLLTRHGS